LVNPCPEIHPSLFPFLRPCQLLLGSSLVNKQPFLKTTRLFFFVLQPFTPQQKVPPPLLPMNCGPPPPPLSTRAAFIPLFQVYCVHAKGVFLFVGASQPLELMRTYLPFCPRPKDWPELFSRDDSCTFRVVTLSPPKYAPPLLPFPFRLILFYSREPPVW